MFFVFWSTEQALSLFLLSCTLDKHVSLMTTIGRVQLSMQTCEE